MRAAVTASLAAILVQLPLFALCLLPRMAMGEVDADELGFYVAAVSIVAAATVLLVGLPVFALLRGSGRMNAKAVALAGLAIGTLPVAVMGWPYHGLYSGYSSSGALFGHAVDFYRNGSPTLYAWLDYLLCMARLGLQGVLGALVFYWVWRRVG
ncbi:MAG TPA: hypothetical protein VF472_06485 [Burkholderiaceae bacterium]